MRLKIQKRSVLKFVSRTIPHSGGYNNTQLTSGFIPVISREGKSLIKRRLIDYQQGSIRDDFNFGHLLLFSCTAIKTSLQKYGSLPSDAGVALYDLRLKISTDYELIHVPQFLYKVSEKEQKKNEISGGAPPAGAGGSSPKRDIPRLAESPQRELGAFCSGAKKQKLTLLMSQPKISLVRKNSKK